MLGVFMEVEFHSQEELYKRILPALKSKKKMLHKEGFKNIKEKDIWNYMRYSKWNKSYGLELCDMVDDILSASHIEIATFKHQEENRQQQEVIELPRLK